MRTRSVPPVRWQVQMYGTPVLGADIGGIPELIQVGKTGELFKSGDGDELKEQDPEALGR